MGTSQTVKPPPRGLFGRGRPSDLPERATLCLHVPPHFQRDSLERFRRVFQQALDVSLAELHAREGRYAGRDSAKRLDPFSAPASAAGGPSFGLIPALTNACKQRRLELKIWRSEVRIAFHRWRIDKTTPFPRGTWQAVERYRARVLS